MKKLVIVLGVLAAFACGARADGIVDVSAVGTFTYGGPSNVLLTFSMNFLFDTTTMQGVPGSMAFTESDAFGLGPFTAPVIGASFTNFRDGAGDLIQVGLNELGPGAGPTFPQVGSYGVEDMVVLCAAADACRDAFHGAGYTQADSGAVLVTPFNSGGTVATPEPGSLLLLLIGLAVIALCARKEMDTARRVAQARS